ncbi:MAG: hypothetical protein DMF85_02990 [Acidobacteria bacterium]|nr:MAG: hypothetical protein DMF85_02990 [Acidobacteriota bacterium]
MEKRLARHDGAITMLSPEPLPGFEAISMPRKTASAERRAPKAARRNGTRAPASPRAAPGQAVLPDGFYRDLVWNLRNGVVAITRDGRIAVMNDVAYRVLGLKPRPTDIGRPFVDVMKDTPDVTRIVAGAFDLSHLPNRAELRLKRTGKVIGYTLSHVRDARGRVVGATMFFKDLTRVEQLEERERLRDRLAHRKTRSPSSPTSSRKRRWRTRSSSRCSSSCGRSGCRSSACRSRT